MPERICELCGNYKTAVMISVQTFSNPDGYIESGEWHCVSCNVKVLTDERDYWVEVCATLKEKVRKSEDEVSVYRDIAENLYESVYGEKLETD